MTQPTLQSAWYQTPIAVKFGVTQPIKGRAGKRTTLGSSVWAGTGAPPQRQPPAVTDSRSAGHTRPAADGDGLGGYAWLRRWREGL